MGAATSGGSSAPLQLQLPDLPCRSLRSSGSSRGAGNQSLSFSRSTCAAAPSDCRQEQSSNGTWELNFPRHQGVGDAAASSREGLPSHYGGGDTAFSLPTLLGSQASVEDSPDVSRLQVCEEVLRRF